MHYTLPPGVACKALFIFGALLAFSLVLPVTAHLSSASAATAAVSGSGTSVPATSKTACLTCHGPFDALIRKTAKYVMPSKEVTSPHRYVPHQSGEAKDVPECTSCHDVHAQPAPANQDLTRNKVDYCYSCHHEKAFTACAECHGSTK